MLAQGYHRLMNGRSKFRNRFRPHPSCLRAVVGLAVVLASGATTARAEVPDYDPPQLQCRANFTAAFNLPDSAFFTNSTASLAAGGRVAIYVSVIGSSDTRGVWLGQDGVGELVYVGPVGAFLSDVSLDDQQRVVFEQRFSAQDGIYFADGGNGTSGFVTNLPFGAAGWGSPQINSAGEIGMRASFASGQVYASYDGVSATLNHVAENPLDPTSPYSFLFTPSFDALRRIAGKVRLGGAGQVGEERPDQIRIFSSDGSSVLIAEDRDSNPASPYDRFDNSVSLTDTGWVAFTATADGVRGVYLSNGVETRTIAIEDLLVINDIEFFGPAANASGQVVFRAFDSAGLRALFVGDGTTLRRVVAEHDLVETDLGMARLDQNTDSSPVFGGGVAINAAGDIAFAAGLTPPDNNQIEWGSGLFVIRARSAIFTDGFESGDTSAWSATTP